MGLSEFFFIVWFFQLNSYKQNTQMITPALRAWAPLATNSGLKDLNQQEDLFTDP